MSDFWNAWSAASGVLTALFVAAGFLCGLYGLFRRTGGHRMECLWCDRKWDISSLAAEVWVGRFVWPRHKWHQHMEAATRWHAAMKRGGRDAAMDDFFAWKHEQRVTAAMHTRHANDETTTEEIS